MPPKPAPEATANVVRRTWNKETYEQKARDREEHGDEFKAADGAAGPSGSKRSWLKHREAGIKLDQAAGSTRILTEPELQKKAQGFYCDVCECLLRDSASYLDHVNGMKHQRKLGFSMRVERVGVDVVVERFQYNIERRKEAEYQATRAKTMDVQAEYTQRLEQRDDDESAAKDAKRDAKRAKREDDAKREKEEEEKDFDTDMNAMMGFGTFGGGAKKKR
ncbi:hypothetical protein M885DRAFT_441555 [Pelagophyceae sp. CCMP2097]|nr:hypothetical protein M885DRAFT_441555 [Pelagophyceae sp. CCMP2097]